MIYGLLIASLVLAVDLFTDYRLWLKDRNKVKPEGSVKHRWGLLIRAIALIPAVILCWGRLVPLILFLYWHLFDGILNLLMGQNWFRVGTTASIDKAQRHWKLLTIFKYTGAVASIIYYYV